MSAITKTAFPACFQESIGKGCFYFKVIASLARFYSALPEHQPRCWHGLAHRNALVQKLQEPHLYNHPAQQDSALAIHLLQGQAVPAVWQRTVWRGHRPVRRFWRRTGRTKGSCRCQKSVRNRPIPALLRHG